MSPSLSAEDLAATTTTWSDQWWDPEMGLVWMPPDRSPDGSIPAPAAHLLPQTAWYAVGLLLRDGPGDHDRALRAVVAVLDHQYDAPGQVWHGTFALIHESPDPVPGARMWLDYDPNWRQFIGCTLLLALRLRPESFDEALTGRIDAALRLAVEGEPEGRIADNYSNIALMHSYVRTEAGHRLGEPDWIVAGEAQGQRVIDLFDRFGTFDEYNSPTYYGIDLLALGLWRGHSSSVVLTELGTRVEAALWLDSVQFFHAGLGNLAGPYTRSYGMDMARYVAAYSLWIWAALGRVHAPTPVLDGPLDHGMDFMLGPVVALIGAEMPVAAIEHLKSFQGERLVTRRLSDESEGDRVAHAWLGPTAMIGIESSTVDLSWWEQFYGCTAHWLRPDGSTGWLRAIVPGPPDNSLEAGRLTIRWHHGRVDPDAEEPVARLVLDRPVPSIDDIDGMTVRSDGPPAERVGAELHLRPGSSDVTTLVLEPFDPQRSP